MTTFNLSLSDEMKAFIEAESARTGHADADNDLRALILEAQKRNAKQELEAKLLEGLEGSAVELTSEDWDEIEQEAQAWIDREITWS